MNENKFKRQIAPGIWEDVDGNPHFNIHELLSLHGLEDTLENRAIATDEIVKLIRERNPQTIIVGRPDA